jgi:hypothetical protein
VKWAENSHRCPVEVMLAALDVIKEYLKCMDKRAEIAQQLDLFSICLGKLSEK